MDLLLFRITDHSRRSLRQKRRRSCTSTLHFLNLEIPNYFRFFPLVNSTTIPKLFACHRHIVKQGLPRASSVVSDVYPLTNTKLRDPCHNNKILNQVAHRPTQYLPHLWMPFSLLKVLQVRFCLFNCFSRVSCSHLHLPRFSDLFVVILRPPTEESNNNTSNKVPPPKPLRPAPRPVANKPMFNNPNEVKPLPPPKPKLEGVIYFPFMEFLIDFSKKRYFLLRRKLGLIKCP